MLELKPNPYAPLIFALVFAGLIVVFVWAVLGAARGQEVVEPPPAIEAPAKVAPLDDLSWCAGWNAAQAEAEARRERMARLLRLGRGSNVVDETTNIVADYLANIVPPKLSGEIDMGARKVRCAP